MKNSSVVRLGILLLLGCSSVFAKNSMDSHQVYFSPQDQVVDRLLAMINSEQRSIQAAVYCLTHKEVADSLIRAHRRGVAVELIVDPFSIKARGPLAKLVKAGIPVFVWDPAPSARKYWPKEKKKKSRPSLMHDKFCIFGQKTVWTGSFNFTYDAHLSNQENVVVVENLETASVFHTEFEQMKRKGCRRYEEYLVLHPPTKKSKGKR